MAPHMEQLDRHVERSNAKDPVQHETASGFVVKYLDGRWRVLLIWHVRLGALTVPGGHVEKGRGETSPEAFVRETREEAGLEVILLSPPAPELPETFPHRILPRPWWSVAGRASADSVTTDAHIHIDQQFIALPSGAEHSDRECEPLWLGAAELEERADILPDTRMQALDILAALDRVGAPREPDALATALFLAMGAV
jgi:8-oxo-dGTP pyrophosphatase MutT (NUDIX family)